MACLTRRPTFRAFSSYTRKASIKASKNCANSFVGTAVVAATPMVTINGQVAIALSSALPGGAFTNEIVVGVSGRLPRGVVLSTTGSFSGTPAIGTNGTYPLAVNAMGMNGRLSSKLFNMVIAP